MDVFTSVSVLAERALIGNVTVAKGPANHASVFLCVLSCSCPSSKMLRFVCSCTGTFRSVHRFQCSERWIIWERTC